jgi:hypothetical protein
LIGLFPLIFMFQDVSYPNTNVSPCTLLIFSDRPANFRGSNVRYLPASEEDETYEDYSDVVPTLDQLSLARKTTELSRMDSQTGLRCITSMQTFSVLRTEFVIWPCHRSLEN